jgi:hypothetical protein
MMTRTQTRERKFITRAELLEKHEYEEAQKRAQDSWYFLLNPILKRKKQ